MLAVAIVTTTIASAQERPRILPNHRHDEDWSVLSVAFDAVRYAIGIPIRLADGHDAAYVSWEFRHGW